MSQQYQVPNIYSDLSDQYQGYFAFRFTCQHCSWAVETRPVRSKVSTATNIMDLGIGMLGGFLGRAAEMGEKIYGSKWHTEQKDALQKAWAEIQHQFHFCPRCRATVCTRCFNLQLNICTYCAPDMKADAAQFQHGLNVEAQRGQIEQQYHAPQFNVNAVPSAVTPDMIAPQALPPGAPPQAALPAPGPAALAGFNTPGYPQTIACPNCRQMGAPGKFCADCGTKLPMPDLFCPQCAAPVEINTRFCADCGTRLHTSS
jgi:hypothetical protein